MSNTNLDDKIKIAEARIKELELLIKHWGWGVGKSINFLADAAGKTEDHVKEIWED